MLTITNKGTALVVFNMMWRTNMLQTSNAPVSNCSFRIPVEIECAALFTITEPVRSRFSTHLNTPDSYSRPHYLYSRPLYLYLILGAAAEWVGRRLVVWGRVVILAARLLRILAGGKLLRWVVLSRPWGAKISPLGRHFWNKVKPGTRQTDFVDAESV